MSLRTPSTAAATAAGGNAGADQPVAGRWSRRDWSVLLITCVGLFVTQLDLTVVNVAVGAIGRRLHASTGAVTWVVDGYFVTFAAFMIGFGDVGDLFGRRRVFLAGLAGFAAASTGCAAAPGVGWLILFRTLQGVAGAAVLVSSLAILADAFDGADRTRAIGVWSAVAGIALVVGPLLGGLIVDGLGWRWIFWINVPISLVSIAAGRRVLRESRRGGHDRHLDRGGQILAVLMLGALAWGLSETAAEPGSVIGWLALGASVLLAAGFVAVERRCATPLVPLSVFRSRTFRGANLASLLLNFATLGLLYLLSLDFEHVDGRSATATGVRIAPLFAAYAAVSMLAGRIADRFGQRVPGTLGGLAAGTGVALVAAERASGAAAGAGLVLAGVGIGLALPAVVSTAVAAVPGARAGLGAGLNNTARQIGGTLGIALLGGVVAGAGSERVGIGRALIAVAAAYTVAAALVASTLRRPAPVRGGPAHIPSPGGSDGHHGRQQP
ncbi:MULTISPECIES: MFS transporter [unclassified Pseudofrankia]|uniref:MFS transporter n=1 Tax=unclassified Pseudofrankia TaxID=2994372 RepID=UPI0008DAB42C|nr:MULTISPECIES: MFS transporter [unclassified Pseudofrankia]MDT3443844.1 MFS transporter [Pseudofrankia sp. BMG5.37]OHV60885.1 MFS transporter [Pseudofrankia sp. BMG5.36]